MLIFFAGKMGAGKSTEAKRMAEELSTVMISEDRWLSSLYPVEISNFDDYLQCAARLRPLIAEHVKALLAAGVTVVLDYPANTPKQRQWFKTIYQDTNHPHRLIYLEADDDVCLSRLKLRNIEQPERQAFDNETVFRQVTQFFQPPKDDEGFNIEILPQSMD